MNILPKKCSQFKDKGYWDHFFQQLKNTKQQFFEWYGNYQDFKVQLNRIFKHIQYTNHKKQNLQIFHIGCGKSTFGEDIQFDYPNFNIINTDYSETIIKDMIKRTLSLKLLICKYEVCDMFLELNPKHVNKFNVVLDKGTLDAILPEDVQDETRKVKQIFFNNVVNALNAKQTSTYVIVSMLQPFVLRVILEYFNTDKYSKSFFDIQIQQSKIKQSKMQPFLVYIKRSPDLQTEKIQQQLEKKRTVTIKLLNGKEISCVSQHEVMNRIQQIQENIMYNQKVKKLVPYQHLTYHISNADNNQKIRYTIEIIDNSASQFIKNNCAVFIVPQGKENLYMFNSQKGLQRFVQQVGTSRFVVVKLRIGNVFKNIDQVKTEINQFIHSFIQEKCNVGQVPFMTDAEQLGQRKLIYENEKLFVEEILTTNDNQSAFRRVVLKSNLQLIQTQFKLMYKSAETASNTLKQLQKKTKILSSKKGKVVSIDRDYLDEGYCRFIVAGLNRLGCFKQKQKVNLQIQKDYHQILILGGGGYALPKFIYENYNIHNKLSLTSVEIEKSLCSEQVFALFEIDEHLKSKDFNIVNADAYEFVVNSQQSKIYLSIIVDVNNNQVEDVLMPGDKMFEKQFTRKCFQILEEGGVLAYNIIRKSFLVNELIQLIMRLNEEEKEFEFAYIGIEENLEKQQNNQAEDNLKEDDDQVVLFLVKKKKIVKNEQKSKQAEFKQSEIDLSHKTKNYKQIFQFQSQSLKSIKMIYPVNKFIGIVGNKKIQEFNHIYTEKLNKKAIKIIKE